MKILVVGGGATGLTLANLLGKEHEITIIEKDPDRAKEIANKTHALVVLGDGTDISILNDAGIQEVDAMVIATADDKTNLMACEIAKSENLPKIISLVNSPKNEELFTKLGISKLVSTVGTNVTHIKRMLYEVGDARIVAQLGGGKMQIAELTVAEEGRLIGKKAKLKNATLAAIYRSGELIIPKRDTTLEVGDVLLVVVKTEDLPGITELISGK